MIPIIIVCHNNGWMVEKTITDIYDKFTRSTFVIVDNGSTASRTLAILEKLSLMPRVVIHRFEDNGHPRRVFWEASLLHYTKNPYILTDPDLDLSTLPNDTIDVFFGIALKYKKFKVGVALDISDTNDLLLGKHIDNELNYWENKIEDSKYELYDAPIDTTFCLIFNQMSTEFKDFWKNNIRVAGNYKVRHLPFHKSYIRSLDEQDYNDYFNVVDTNISTTSSIIKKYRQELKI